MPRQTVENQQNVGGNRQIKMWIQKKKNRHVIIINLLEEKMMIVRIQGQDDFFASCKEMATIIAEILKTQGSCTTSDVAAEGFLPSEIKRLFPMAYALAKVELNWMDA